MNGFKAEYSGSTHRVEALVGSGTGLVHREVEELRDDEPDDTEHSNTAVLQLSLLKMCDQ